MIVAFTKRAMDDLNHWIVDDPKFARKILDLIDAVQRDPYSGIGKPEPLKHELAGRWSRRLNDEHRLVYRVFELNGEKAIEITACRYHYSRK